MTRIKGGEIKKEKKKNTTMSPAITTIETKAK